ncbi:MAG: DegT/DnrJ/EryC1/StrS family aminotransferase [Phycisphaeraceae bacterium]|nr:DegT/DnrJ/EryC1/StrS family aminotransferase [Phycisphaeraceae bacterium]
MTKTMADAEKKLALHGGTKVRGGAWPARRLFGEEEKRAVMVLFDKAIASGEAFGYEGEEEQGYCREFVQWMNGETSEGKGEEKNKPTPSPYPLPQRGRGINEGVSGGGSGGDTPAACGGLYKSTSGGFADGVNSGTTAVWVALRALELEPGTEVIVPGVTDPGGVMPVALNHCIPVPADVAPGTYNVGAEQIEARITSRTSAIVVAHIMGYPCDMGPIVELAKRKGLPLVEDCAQSHGARYQGKMVGRFGTIAAFSTMFGKHHATGGQGGVVYVPTEEMYWKVRRFADRGKPFGLAEQAGNVVAGLNCNMDELHAAIGRVQLKKLPGLLAARRKTAAALARGCQERLQAIRVVEPPAGGESSYWCPFLRVDLARVRVDKNTIVAALAAEGLPAESSYFNVPTQLPWSVQRRVFGQSGLPWTSSLYKGDPKQVYDVPNVRATDAQVFRILFHERCGDQEVADVLAALEKVEAAWVK